MNARTILRRASAAGLLDDPAGWWMRIPAAYTNDDALDYMSDRQAVAARIGRAYLQRGMGLREEYALDIADRMLAEAAADDWLETRAQLARLGMPASHFARAVLRDERAAQK